MIYILLDSPRGSADNTMDNITGTITFVHQAGPEEHVTPLHPLRREPLDREIVAEWHFRVIDKRKTLPNGHFSHLASSSARWRKQKDMKRQGGKDGD